MPCPTAAPFGIQSTCPPVGHFLTWGDNNCSGDADPVDALITLRHDAGLSANTGDCPDMSQEITFPPSAALRLWGDIDCSQSVNPVDALKLLRFDAGLPVDQPLDCPEPGAEVFVN